MKKNKMKTHRGAAKRLRITRRGKVVSSHAWKSHLLAKKKAKRKRKLRKTVAIHKSSVKKIYRLLPYGTK